MHFPRKAKSAFLVRLQVVYCMCLFLLPRTFIPVVSSGWLASAFLPLCSPVINIFSVCHNRAHLTHNKAAHKFSQPRGKCTAFRFPAVRRWNRLQRSVADAHTDKTALETVTPYILLIKDVRLLETPVVIHPSSFSLYSLISWSLFVEKMKYIIFAVVQMSEICWESALSLCLYVCLSISLSIISIIPFFSISNYKILCKLLLN